MAFNTTTGAYTAATGATTAQAGDVIRSATWNSIFTDIQTALTQLGQGTFAPPMTELVLANGANSNITLATTLCMRITGPSGAFSISGFAGGASGDRIFLYNSTTQVMTITNDATSTNINRILTGTGADIILPAQTSFVVLTYSGDDSRWLVQGIYYGKPVTGPASVTDNQLARYNGTSGGLVDASTTVTLLNDNGSITVAATVTTAAGGTVGVGFKLGSGTNLGIFWGSSGPTIAAAQGSLYIRTDGSSSVTRLYVNSDGNTTWIPIISST